MSIQSLLENLKQKPESTRKRYAFLFSFSATLIIFFFWLGSRGVIDNPASRMANVAMEKVQTPAQSLVASVGSFFGDIKDIFFGPKKISYTSIEVSPGNN
jgi:hypothetical protein